MARVRTRWKPWSDHPIVVILSLLAATATIAVFLRGCQLGGGSDLPLIVRVSGDDGSSISGAKVLLFYQGGSLSQFTDSNGVAAFPSTDASGDSFRLIVEHEKYDIHESQFRGWGREILSVRLKERSPTSSNVILRVVGSSDGIPVSNAEIALISGGSVFRQVTDSDGFAQFTLEFPIGGSIDARISVMAEEYQIGDQVSTLLPGRLQYILLSPTSFVVELPTIPTSRAEPTEVEAEGSDGVVEPPSGVQLTYLEAGEGIRVVLLGPNGTPWDGVYVEAFQQVPDVSGNPTRGQRIGTGRISPQGEVDFPVGDGVYEVCTGQAPGYGWDEGPCVYEIEVRQNQTVQVGLQVGSLEIAIVGADGEAWTNVYYEVFTQRHDVGGNPVTDNRVASGRTDNRGLGEQWLTQGLYAVRIDLRGYNWGSLKDAEGEANVEVKPGQTTRLTIEMGRLEIGLTGSDGRPETNVYLEVHTQGTAVDGSPTSSDRVWSGRTDNGGFARIDLTAGIYALKRGEEILYGVPISWGVTTRTDGEAIE